MRFPNAAIVERLRNQYPAVLALSFWKWMMCKLHQSEPKEQFLELMILEA